MSSYYYFLASLITVQIIKISKFLFFIFGCSRCSLLACRLYLVSKNRDCSWLQCAGFSFQWLLLWNVGSRALAQKLWCVGLTALRHVGSSWTRDQTLVFCIGRQILYHRATSEAPKAGILKERGSPHPEGGCFWLSQ